MKGNRCSQALPRTAPLREGTAIVHRLSLRRTAMALARGDASPIVLALDRAASDLERQVELCEQLMSAYAALWNEDECSGVDIEIGLSLAQVSFHLQSTAARTAVPRSGKRPFLVVPMPDETHILGGALAAAVLADAGMFVRYRFPTNGESLEKMLDEQAYRGMVLITSGVFARSDRIPEIGRILRSARRHADPSCRIAVYGRFADPERLVADGRGCDACVHSATELTALFRHAAEPRH